MQSTGTHPGGGMRPTTQGPSWSLCLKRHEPRCRCRQPDDTRAGPSGGTARAGGLGVARRTAIGLDIGSSGVRAAELSINRQQITLERFGQIAVPDGAIMDGVVVDHNEVTAALKQLWTATKFSTKKVVLGIANQRVLVRTVDLSYMPLDALKKTLHFQVADMLPMEPEEALLDFHPLQVVQEENEKMLRGMLVAAHKEHVQANIDAVQAADLDPIMVDLTSFAVLRSVGRQFDPLIDTEAIVDIGARVTNVIVHSAGNPRFVRILLMGGETVTDALTERLGVTRDHAEVMKQKIGLQPQPDDDPTTVGTIEEAALEFVDQVRGSLDYYNASHPENPIDRVSVSGGASCLPGLLDQLSAATRLAVVPADPMATLTMGNTGLDDEQLSLVQPLSAVPVGLALGAIPV